MTRDKGFKKKVRARMAKTGERYSTARAKLLAASPRSLYGGVHTDTAAIRGLLAEAGIGEPHTGAPFDEAMLLGLGGGIGAAYYVFEYAGHLPTLYVETRVAPQYPYTAGFFERIAGGLGIEVEIAESGGAKKAAANLEAALERGRSALAWVDLCALPHHYMGDSAGGALPHVVLVAGIDGDTAEIYDRSSEPLAIDRADLESARQRLRKAKNRVLSIAPGSVSRSALSAAITAGLRRCVAGLDGETDAPGHAANMGLAGLDKWAELIDDARSKKGWPRAFARGPALAMGLRQAYYWIEAAGTGGGGFRSMFADFLEQAARALDRGALDAIAGRYRELAVAWTALVDRMLPASGRFGEIRARLDAIEAALIDGPDATGAIGAAREELEALTEAEGFPLDEAETADLYADLGARLRRIAAAEREARDALAAAL
jgi:hypothetical protein